MATRGNLWMCMPYNALRHYIVKGFINKSSKQFASVSAASIPDSRAFYRVVINQRGQFSEKEGHNMQMSPLDLPMHNGAKKEKKRPSERAFFPACVQMHN